MKSFHFSIFRWQFCLEVYKREKVCKHKWEPDGRVTNINLDALSKEEREEFKTPEPLKCAKCGLAIIRFSGLEPGKLHKWSGTFEPEDYAPPKQEQVFKAISISGASRTYTGPDGKRVREELDAYYDKDSNTVCAKPKENPTPIRTKWNMRFKDE